MKHDINLLQKRKATQYSGKKLGTVLLFALLFAALLYAGIALPSRSLQNAKIQLADLNNQIASQATVDQDLTQKTQRNAVLQEELTQLQALGSTRQDVEKYLGAVESSLPTSASIMALKISDSTMTITGVAPRDEVLATFALRLRETKAFSSVFVTSSTITGKSTLFSIKALLPATLNDTANVTDGSDSAKQSDSGSGNSDNSGQDNNKNDSDAIMANGGGETVASANSSDSGEANQ